MIGVECWNCKACCVNWQNEASPDERQAARKFKCLNCGEWVPIRDDLKRCCTPHMEDKLRGYTTAQEAATRCRRFPSPGDRQ